MADETTTNIIELEAEQENYFKLLASATSESLAYFYCCIKYDLPFDLDCVPRDGTKSRWTAYRNNLRRKGLDRNKRNGNPRVFLDGLTDITAVFGERLDSGEFTRAVTIEQNARDGKQGTKRQRAEWGELGEGNHRLTTADYDRLDQLYEYYSDRLEKTGDPDAQQKHVLRTVSRFGLEMEKATAAKNAGDAQKWNKMILENLAAENLRAKDQAPVENFRIDSLVDALQKAKILDKNKKILPLPELQEVLLRRMGALGQKPAHKYKYTFDAAEHMLLAIMNCMYRNEGMEELTELPEDAKFPESMKCEFAEEPNEEEQKAYSELGLLRKKH